MQRFTWLLWLVCFAASPAAGRQARSQKSPSDQRIEESVRRAIAASGIESRAVVVHVTEGVVTLRGEVQNARDKLWLIEAAFAVPEVQAVESELVLRNAVTPEVEEEVWRVLLDEGLDRFLSEVLVRDGVASLRGEVPDAATHDRVLRVARGVAGVASVRDGVDVTVEASEEENPAPREETVAVKATDEAPRSEPVIEAPPAEREIQTMDEPAPMPPAPSPEEPAMATNPPVARDRPPTPSLQQQIAVGILSYPDYTVFDHVRFGMEGQDVVLLGVVTKASKKQELEARLRAISGIATLRNELYVLPESRADDRLRDELFRRIYEDRLFAEFAEKQNPPVHILVEGGRVTLTGIVDERIQQMSAEAMVRNVFGVKSVRNQIQIRDPGM